MDGVLPQLGLVALLVLVNAAFAGTEMALVSLRDSQLQRLAERSRSGAVLLRLVGEPTRYLATIQIGITLAGFLASATAAVSLAEPLREPLSALGSAAEAVAILLVTLVLSYLTLVLGELAPKRVAMQHAERWGVLAARPLAAMLALTRPAVWLLARSTDIAVRLLGSDPDRPREEITEAELRDMVAAQPTFSDKQRLIIQGAFEIAERSLAEVLRPRRDVMVLDADLPATRALSELAASGHSRAPVGERGTLDEVVGVVHLRDLLEGGDRPVRELVSELCAFPESADVLDAMHELQTRREQMAVVIDEHGSAAGIVTIEDLVEELVGEIYDEADRDVVAVSHGRDGSMTLAGGFPIHDLVDVGIEDVPNGPYATLAGLLLERLGRIPERPGDIVEVGEWSFEVTAVDRRAIVEVCARRTGGQRRACDGR